MSDIQEEIRCTAFAGHKLLASGSAAEVALAVKAAGPEAQALIFNDEDGRQIDFDLSGSDADIVARLARSRGRGRPKLGVVPREVTLLPRHWDWLARQKGGASVALRRLIDEAQVGAGDADRKHQAQEAAYRFMSAIGGDLPGFEEASRALFAGRKNGFEGQIAAWPGDVREHVLRLARAAC